MLLSRTDAYDRGRLRRCIRDRWNPSQRISIANKINFSYASPSCGLRFRDECEKSMHSEMKAYSLLLKSIDNLVDQRICISAMS